MHRERPLIIVIALWALTTVLWLTPGILRPDAAGYYVYLTSTWNDHDLLLFNDWQQFGLVPKGAIFFQEVTKTDHMGNQWAAGSSVFWYPSFVFGDLMQRIVPGAGRFARNGISLPYNIATITASALAGLAALLLGYALARRYVRAELAALAAGAVWFGTPLLWYSLRNSLMAHAPSALVTGAALFVCTKLTERVTWPRLLSAGALIGLALAIRPQNAPFVLIPLFFIPRGELGRALRNSWAYAVGGLLGAGPQLLVSWTLYRDPFRVVAHSEQTMTWVWDMFARYWFVETLFSWYHGAITWAPITAVGVIGLVLLVRSDRRFGLAGLFVFSFDWIANSVIDRAFWSGYSFGQRRFDNLTVFLIVGCAVALARLPRWAAWLVAAACSLWTMALFVAALHVDLNYYLTGRELLESFFSSVENVRQLFVPFAFVPPGIRPLAAAMFFLTILVAVTVAILVRRAYGASERAGAMLLAGYFVVIAAFYGYCGVSGRAHIERFRALIDHNRSLGARVGWLPAKLELLRRESEYEHKSGRAELAEQTDRDIQRLEDEIQRSPGRQLP